MKDRVNIYYACRKAAAEHNERLNSRELTAELLGISPSTLANYELGVTKSIPADAVVMMADLYHAPQLKNLYCRQDCPIGRNLPLATELTNIEQITVRLLNSLDDDRVDDIKRTLLEIATDGKVSREEVLQIKAMMEPLQKIEQAISELRMLHERHASKDEYLWDLQND